jgi:O-antigen/teichoic acid export membrane protein
LKPAEIAQKPWRQLLFVLGDAVLSIISGGVIFIIISRVSGPELLGRYALAFSWLIVFQGVSIFGIPGFLLREVGAYGRDATEQVVHGLLLGLGSGFVALCLMLGAVRLMGYPAYEVHVIDTASLALIPGFFIVTCRSVFLALRQMQFTFLVTSVEVAITVFASLYLLFSGHGAISLMIAVVCAKATSAALALALLHYRVLPLNVSVGHSILKRTAATVFTFGIGNMLGMLTVRISTIIVSVWVDIATVGHFAAATKIMELGLTVPNLFVQLLMTRIAYSFNVQGDRDPNRFGAWYQLMFAFVLPACVGGWVFAGLILELLFGPGFENAVWIVKILMIYLLIESVDVVMSIYLQSAHRQREDIIRLAFNPLTNVVVSLALLPPLGMIGAAIGRVAGVGVSATLRHLLIAREFASVHWFRFALKPALISVTVGSVCYLLQGAGHPIWLLLSYVAANAVLLVVCSCVSRTTIKDLMSFRSN